MSIAGLRSRRISISLVVSSSPPAMIFLNVGVAQREVFEQTDVRGSQLHHINAAACVEGVRKNHLDAIELRIDVESFATHEGTENIGESEIEGQRTIEAEVSN